MPTSSRAKHKPGGIINIFIIGLLNGHYKVSGPKPLKLGDHHLPHIVHKVLRKINHLSFLLAAIYIIINTVLAGGKPSAVLHKRFLWGRHLYVKMSHLLANTSSCMAKTCLGVKPEKRRALLILRGYIYLALNTTQALTKKMINIYIYIHIYTYPYIHIYT